MILGIISELDMEEFDVNYIIEQYKPSVVLMGGSRNSASLREALEANNVPVIVFQPWSQVDTRLKHYKKQFFYRNKQLIDNSDEVLLIVKNLTKTFDTEVSSSIKYLDSTNKRYTFYEDAIY